jgi:PAS domain S-box-containing protein
MKLLHSIRGKFVLLPPDLENIREWRGEILSVILFISVVLGAVAAVPSILVALRVGYWSVAIVDVIALAWGVLVWRSRSLSYRARASNFCALLYLLGVALLFSIGAASQIWLMTFPVMTALLLGLGPALFSIALNTVTFLLVGYLVNSDFHFAAGFEAQPALEWTVLTINFTVASSLITISCIVLLQGLERSFERKRESETRFREFANVSADWFYETDADHRYTWFAGALEKGVGRPPEFYIGKTRMEVARMGGADMSAEPWKSHLEVLARREPYRDFEDHRITPSGEFWLTTNGTPYFGADGRFLGYRAATKNVTERERAVKELRASEEKFAKAFRSSPDFIAISTVDEGRYIEINEAFTLITGYSREEAIGRTAFDIGLWVDLEDRRKLVELLRRQERARNLQIRFRKKSGEIIFTESSVETIEIEGVNCILSVAQDVTQRKAAMEALYQSEQRLRDLVTTSSDWFWEQDAQFRFTIMSDDLYSKAQVFPSATLGKHRWELPIEGVSEEQWKAHRALLERHESFEAFIYQMRNDGGELRWFSINGRPFFGSDGIFQGYRGTGHDITEQVHLDQRLRQTQRMEAVGQLAGGIAHDFNNILAAIRGGVQLAKADLPAGHPAATGIDQVEKSAARAVELVRQILAFSRGQDNVRTAQDLPVAVQGAVQVLRAALPSAIEIRTQFKPGLRHVRTNATAVHQVLMNLGINAAHAISGAGSLEIEVDEVEVDRALAEKVPDLNAGRYVRLTVRDSGIGMDRATQARIFEPFYSTKAGAGGTGLGLSVVYGIVREHGGAIGVNSAAGAGTEFRIYFPAVERAAPEAARPPEAIPAATDGKGERLLFVDDEEDLVMLSCKLLERMGYRVHGCYSGEEALAAFARNPGSFDAMITDITMPGIAGIELAEKVLALRPKLPIILMSGHVQDAHARRARSLGLGEIHWKPSTVEDLAETLRQRLARVKG